MKEYNVVNVQFTHPSFSWNNGLYIVIEIVETELRMCKLKDDFTLQLHKDGSFMISCTYKDHEEVHKTNLKYYHEKDN